VSRIFISHSSVNNAAAIALGEWLAEQGFGDVFLDVNPDRGIAPGERWQEALRVAADRCEAVLFLVSPAWLASKWCLTEFLLAKQLHKRIFGLIVEPVSYDRLPIEMTSEWQLCELVGENQNRLRTFEVEVASRCQRVAFGEAGLHLLRRGLERAGLAARSFPWPPSGEPNRAPYRGLRALEPQDAAIFFGRDAAIVRALDRIRGLVAGGVEKFLVVLGCSGSGKSSFLRAGLWPRLARDYVTFLPLPVIRPESAVINGNSGLAAAMATAFEQLGERYTVGRIKELLAREPGSFVRLLGELSDLAKRKLAAIDEASSHPVIVLCIDQAEELFNVDGATEARDFLDFLAAILVTGQSSPRVIVIATIRSDRYELLQAEPRLAAVKQDLFNLPPLPALEFKSVIEGPARRMIEAGGRLEIDPALTEQLIADAQGADALPLLAFTLERLYADYGRSGHLTIADYQSIGGVQGSIEAAVTNALVEPGRSPAIPTTREAQFSAMRAAFIPWLARIDPETGVPMRRVARLDDVPQASRNIVLRFIEARLLLSDRRAGVDVVEVAHESLLRQWSALTAWLEADADNLKLVEAVERAANEWARQGRYESWLDHRAERLAAADGLAGRDDFRKRLGEEGLAYLQACRAREDSERKEKEEALVREQLRLTEVASAQHRTARLQRAARWMLAAMALAVLVGLGLGFWQRSTNLTLQETLQKRQLALDQGHISLMAELAAAAQLRGNFDSALRLAAQGVRLELALGNHPGVTLPASTALAAAVFQSDWRLVLSGHESAVWFAAFSPDQSRIVTASWDKTARIWDTATGKEIRVLRGHQGELSSAMFSPDGSRILTASTDRTARIWDAASGAELVLFTGHHEQVWFATFSPDGKRVVTASWDRTARIWDSKTGQEIAVLRGHTDHVVSAAFNRDGSRVVTSSEDKSVRLWDAATGKQIAVMHGHEGSVWSAAFSTDGSRIITASADRTVRIWDVIGQKEVLLIRGHDDTISSATFSPDGNHVVTASWDKTARIWDAATGKEIAVLRGHEDVVTSATFDADGTLIVTSSPDRTARIWSTRAKNELSAFRKHEDSVASAVFRPDGRAIVTASSDQTAQVWDAATGMVITALDGHDAEVNSASFSRDGTLVVTASGDQSARVWEAKAGSELAVLRGHTDVVLSAAFNPDQSRVVTASWDRTARIWDVRLSHETAVLAGHEAEVTWAAFSPDGKRVVTASWDKTARIWDAATGKEIAVLRGHDAEVNSAAFSPDGSHIVTASHDKTARIWRAPTWKEVAVLRGHESVVASALFSSDGSRIVTASYDKTARIWDAATSKEMAVLRGHDAEVNFASFSPDGARVATASMDKTAKTWDVHVLTMSAHQLLTEVCARRLRQLSKLTRDEMRLAGYSDSMPTIDACGESR
jgi:WD40 repeat protein